MVEVKAERKPFLEFRIEQALVLVRKASPAVEDVIEQVFEVLLCQFPNFWIILVVVYLGKYVGYQWLEDVLIHAHIWQMRVTAVCKDIADQVEHGPQPVDVQGVCA